MSTTNPTRTAPAPTAALDRLRLTALVIVVLTLAQFAIGIAMLVGSYGLSSVHGWLGYGNFIAAIVAAVFAFQASRVSDRFKGLFMHATSLPVLALIQIGLIEALDGSAIRWVHVVLGVAYLVAAIGLFALAKKRAATAV